MILHHCLPALASLTTAADILLPPTVDLTKKLRSLKLDAVHDLVRAVSRAIVPVSGRMDELLGKDDEEGDGDWLGTGDAGLDQCLGGGLRIGCLTEFTGER